LYFIINYFSN